MEKYREPGAMELALPFQISKQVTQNGKTVLLTVQERSGNWWLRIIGRGGQVSRWGSPFPSAMDALIAGLTALRTEGIDDYFDDPVFACLELVDRLEPP